MKKLHYLTVAVVLMFIALVSRNYYALNVDDNHLDDEMIVDFTADNPLCCVPSEESYGSIVRCISLKAVTLPANITAIPNETFAGSEFTTFTLNDDITSIDWKTCLKCTSLKTLTISNNSSLEHFNE